jgi:hypothetical protein
MRTSLRVTGVLPGLESSVVPGILTAPTVESPKPLRHNHPGEPATRAMTTHPDSRQGRPMATPVGDRADSGSLLDKRPRVQSRRLAMSTAIR